MRTSGWDVVCTRRSRRLSAVSAKESAHIDQASQEAVRLLTILLLLLVIATYYSKRIMADCCFPCICGMSKAKELAPTERLFGGCPVGGGGADRAMPLAL